MDLNITWLNVLWSSNLAQTSSTQAQRTAYPHPSLINSSNPLEDSWGASPILINITNPLHNLGGTIINLWHRFVFVLGKREKKIRVRENPIHGERESDWVAIKADDVEAIREGGGDAVFGETAEVVQCRSATCQRKLSVDLLLARGRRSLTQAVVCEELDSDDVSSQVKHFQVASRVAVGLYCRWCRLG